MKNVCLLIYDLGSGGAERVIGQWSSLLSEHFNVYKTLFEKTFLYPAIFADLYSEKLSWFTGFDEKYFYDTGSFLKVAYSQTYHLFK